MSTGETKEEVMSSLMTHMKEAHADKVSAMDAMSPEDVEAWNQKVMGMIK